MKNKEEDIRGFILSNKAYYKSVIDKKEIMFGLYDNNGGTMGEMAMVWYSLGNKIVPRLECFDDGWAVLSTFKDVISILGQYDNKNITQEEFANILLSCNFKDLTLYEEGGVS